MFKVNIINQLNEIDYLDQSFYELPIKEKMIYLNIEWFYANTLNTE